MGRNRARGRNDAGQPLLRHFGELDGADILAGENGAIRIACHTWLPGLQVHQYSPTQIPHVCGTLAQVRVIHGVENAGVLLDRLAQGSGCPVTRTDQFFGPIYEGIAAQHHDPGVEQRAILFRQAVTDASLQRAQILFIRAERRPKAVDLALRFAGGTVGHRVKIRGRVGYHHLAEGHARGAGPPLQITGGKPPAVIRAHDQLAAGLRVGNRAGQLGSKRQQQVDLVVLEAPRSLLAHYEYTQDLAVLDDRRTEKTVIFRLAGFGHEQVALMGRCVIEIERFRTLAHQAHQAAQHGQAHLAHGLPAQPVGGHEHVLAGIEVGQVDRADIGIDRHLDPVDDDVQRLVEVPCRAHLLDDAAQGIEDTGFGVGQRYQLRATAR